MILLAFIACSRAPIEDRWTHDSLTQIKDAFTSSFALDTTEGWILIDTGFNRNAKPVETFFEENNIQLSDIESIVVTHGHGDHIGAHSNFPNATFYVHEKDKDLLEEEAVKNISTYIEGDTFTFGESTIRPFETPGHTEGNVALIVDDVLLMGDTAQSTRSGTLETVSPKYADDAEQAEQSLIALQDKIEPYKDDISWIVFSHSGPLQGVDALYALSPE